MTNPPTAPDVYSFRELSEGRPAGEVLDQMITEQRREGVTFCRATLVNAQHEPAATDEVATGIWLEGWLTRPDNQGPFEPPLTRDHQ